MNDWIVDSIKEEIELEISRMKSLNSLATNLKNTYKDVLQTKDKFSRLI